MEKEYRKTISERLDDETARKINQLKKQVGKVSPEVIKDADDPSDSCLSISPSRYYKDDLCWSADLKSKTTEDIINIRSFMKALVLNHYVLVRKI
nr:V-type proton ATPase subunit G1 [Tanacetum cinerariifolium]GEY59243.1 V-type proton ATPase subunit G1 [Tanacetum cinerariifolium]